MGSGLVVFFIMWISLRLGGSGYQLPIVHYRGIVNVGGHEMLQFDWSTLAKCECIIRGSGIIINYHLIFFVFPVDEV